VRAALAEPVGGESDAPVASTLAAEDRQELLAAVRGLDDGDRHVIAYRFLLDRSEAETAALLDWPLGTVKSRTSRALAKLRSRLGIAISVVVVIALIVAVPPARSAVAHAISHVLRFAGIEVNQEPGAANRVSIPPSPQPLPSTRQVTLAEARRLAHFRIGVPAALSAPEQVWVSDPAADGAPRVVSLIFRSGSIRIDEFDGRLDLLFAKVSRDVTWMQVGAADGLWLARPHPLTYVDRSGVSQSATARLAGPTLIWQSGDVGYRLEGIATSSEAVAVAASVT
jgi:hypothetical protein